MLRRGRQKDVNDENFPLTPAGVVASLSCDFLENRALGAGVYHNSEVLGDSASLRMTERTSWAVLRLSYFLHKVCSPDKFNSWAFQAQGLVTVQHLLPRCALRSGAFPKLWQADTNCRDSKRFFFSQCQLFITSQRLTDASIASDWTFRPPQTKFYFSSTHFYAQNIARPCRVTATLGIAQRPQHFSGAHLLSESGVWLLFLHILDVCRSLILRDATEVPLHSCWRSCDHCASRLRAVGAGRFDWQPTPTNSRRRFL